MSLDRVLPRQTSTGLARGVQQLGSPNVYVDSGNENIVVAKNDSANTSTPQVLMGNQVNFGEGFYVTKPGIDVTSAKSPDDFIFNSNQNVFKIVKTGFLTIPGYSGGPSSAGNYLTYTSTTTEHHGLSYVPAVLGYYSDTSSTSFLPLPYSIALGSGTTASWFSVSIQVYEDIIEAESVTTITGNTTFTNGDITVKYYLLQESLH